MRALLILVGLAALALLGAWSVGLVDIGQTKTARAPEFNVEGGQAPEFTVNMAKIDIGMENKTIELPTLTTTEKTISVPTMTVEKPANAQAAEAE